MTLPSLFAAAISSGVTAEAGGAAACTRVAASPSASALAPFSRLRRETTRIAASNLEVLGVALLDLFAFALHRSGVVLHDLDVLHRLPAGVVLDQRVRGSQPAEL